MTKIYFFSRTGDCEKIAAEIAGKTGGEVRRITDDKNWRGFFGFIRGGYYSAAKKKTTAEFEKPQDGDTIYLCFPVWASTFPPAVRSFVEEVGCERIIAVPKSRSSVLKDKDGFIKVIDIIGKDLSVSL